MSRVKQASTYQDYLALPEDRRFELIEGELCMVPSPSFFHQAIARNLVFLLWHHVKANDLGVVVGAPMDLVLSDHDVVQPDVMFISKAMRGIITEASIQGTPDLIVEIVSPTHRERDLLVKKTLYARYKVSEYWVVDPGDRTIEQLVHTGEAFQSRGLFSMGEAMQTPLLPGLVLPVTEVFEPA